MTQPRTLGLSILLMALAAPGDVGAQELTATVGANGSLLEAYNKIVPDARLTAGNTQARVYNFTDHSYYGVASLADAIHLQLLASELYSDDSVGPKDLGRKARRLRLVYRDEPIGLPQLSTLIKAPPGKYIWYAVFWFDAQGRLNHSAWFEPLP